MRTFNLWALLEWAWAIYMYVYICVFVCVCVYGQHISADISNITNTH